MSLKSIILLTPEEIRLAKALQDSTALIKDLTDCLEESLSAFDWIISNSKDPRIVRLSELLIEYITRGG